MVHSLLLLAQRKEGTTLAQFKTHWENNHVPLLMSIAGADAPLKHTRYYLARTEEEGKGGPRNKDSPAVVIYGTQEDFDFDGFAIVEFEDREHAMRFVGKLSAPGNAERVHEDEAKFADRENFKAVVLGDVKVWMP